MFKFIKEMQVPAKNPVTGDTWNQRYREYLCRRRGMCMDIGQITGLPQSHCVICGAKGPMARDDIPMADWKIPHGDL